MRKESIIERMVPLSLYIYLKSILAITIVAIEKKTVTARKIIGTAGKNANPKSFKMPIIIKAIEK
jgi:hypothetical protein